MLYADVYCFSFFEFFLASHTTAETNLTLNEPQFYVLWLQLMFISADFMLTLLSDRNIQSLY